MLDTAHRQNKGSHLFYVFMCYLGIWGRLNWFSRLGFLSLFIFVNDCPELTNKTIYVE